MVPPRQGLDFFLLDDEGIFLESRDNIHGARLRYLAEPTVSRLSLKPPRHFGSF
jgi:hypothetical protein